MLPEPLDAEALRGAYDWLVGTLGLHPSLVEGPTFAIRVYHYWKAQDPPHAPLMGSFFLEDLAAVRKLVTAGTAPTALRSYLGITKRAERKDVLAARRARHCPRSFGARSRRSSGGTPECTALMSSA